QHPTLHRLLPQQPLPRNAEPAPLPGSLHRSDLRPVAATIQPTTAAATRAGRITLRPLAGSAKGGDGVGPAQSVAGNARLFAVTADAALFPASWSERAGAAVQAGGDRSGCPAIL